MQFTCHKCNYHGDPMNGIEKAKGTTARDEKQLKYVVCDNCDTPHEVNWEGKTVTVVRRLPMRFGGRS